ncbi:unnamed protein product [Moneuplotes crassus]|uniref:Uncharacterized protein n=2 Tax=Euplotes crassus TaxID=5936 RepID=A0AAD1Y105_EUPCR|nr:unnamed protein product [Moneuplotes crassus]
MDTKEEAKEKAARDGQDPSKNTPEDEEDEKVNDLDRHDPYDDEEEDAHSTGGNRNREEQDVEEDDFYDEESKGPSGLSRESHSRGRRDAEEEDEEEDKKRDENQGLLEGQEGHEEGKNEPILFTPIKSEGDPIDFERKTQYRFPLTSRLFKACCCCFSGKRNIEVMRNDQIFEEFKGEEYKSNKIEIKINKSGPLALDQYILHPFVKVHLVDLRTYKYLAKANMDIPGVYNREKISYYNSHKVHFQHPNVDYYLPLSTAHYDLRDKAENFCSWYESFSVDIRVEDFLNPYVVILFEILDYSAALLLENSKKLNADKMLPIAWGFLRPIGCARQHLADSQIQLYYYKGRHTKERRMKNEIDLRTPDVLCELNWPNKTKYPSYLEINLNFLNDEVPQTITHFSRYPWEYEVGLREFSKRPGAKRAVTFGRKRTGDQEPEERMKYYKWERAKNEGCKLPNKFLRKLETEELGAFRIKFSNNGDFLAVACSVNNSRTILKIFQVTTGEILMKLKGHHDLIHDIIWSNDDKILSTCSADGSVKIWDVSSVDQEGPNKLDHNENDTYYYICELIHPSYVYGGKFYKEGTYKGSRYKILVTICYDQVIRFWHLEFNSEGVFTYKSCIKSLNFLNLDSMRKALIENKLDMDFLQNPTLANHVYPNCIMIDKMGKLFVGDSIGLIRTWDLSYLDGEIYADNYFIIKHKEIEDDTVNKIMIDPDSEDKIIVHSRDSCIRIIEFDRDLKKDAKVRTRLFGARSAYQMIRSCASPDGAYLASGSEKGNINVWNIHTEERFSQEYNCKFLDSTCDVDWNNKFNMIATCGFGESYPVLIYVYEKTQKEVYFSMGRNLVDEDLFDGSESLVTTNTKSHDATRTEYSDGDRRSVVTDNRTDEYHSYFSDRNSESRLGRPSHRSEDDNFHTPKK